jgi:hypothetical protein
MLARLCVEAYFTKSGDNMDINEDVTQPPPPSETDDDGGGDGGGDGNNNPITPELFCRYVWWSNLEKTAITTGTCVGLSPNKKVVVMDLPGSTAVVGVDHLISKIHSPPLEEKPKPTVVIEKTDTSGWFLIGGMFAMLAYMIYLVTSKVV